MFYPYRQRDVKIKYHLVLPLCKTFSRLFTLQIRRRKDAIRIPYATQEASNARHHHSDLTDANTGCSCLGLSTLTRPQLLFGKGDDGVTFSNNVGPKRDVVIRFYHKILHQVFREFSGQFRLKTKPSTTKTNQDLVLGTSYAPSS
jgi:hypothetical protein